MKHLPPLHKKRLIQGVAAFVAVAALAGALVFFKGGPAAEQWQAQIPAASAPIGGQTAAEETARQDIDSSDFTSTAEAEQAATPEPATPAAPAGTATITLIVTDAGLSSEVTAQMAEDLPPEVVFAFSPYVPNVREQMAAVQEKGRQTLMLLPMEPFDYPRDDPGPQALLTRLGLPENMQRLNWALGRAGGYVGVMNMMGGRFLSDRDDMMPVLETLKEKKMIFVEQTTTGVPHATEAVKAAGIRYHSSVSTIDTVPDPVSIASRLQDAEREALAGGHAVIVAQPYPVTLAALKGWIGGLEKRGLRLVPLRSGE